MMADWNIVLMAVHLTACVVMSAVLLAYRQGRSMAERHYRQVLMTLACVILARIIPDVLFFVFGYSERLYEAMLLYLRPIVSLAELWAGFFVFYRSVHAMAKYLQPLYYVGWVILGLLLLHPVLFVEYVRWGKQSWSIVDYMAYCQTMVGVVQRAAVYVLIVWVFVSNVLILLSLYLRVARSGRQSANEIGHHLRLVYHGCAGVLMLYVTSFTVTAFLDNMWWQIMMLVVLVMDYSVLVYVLNHHAQFLYYEREVQNMAMRVSRSRQQAMPEEIDWQSREQEVVYRLLDDWSKRGDRPFDRPDLTLQDVADELHLPAEVVLRDGMSMYGVRFEEYICLLRATRPSSLP